MHVVCLPPHSTHKLQLLGLPFMQPLKTYHAQELEIWLKNRPNRYVTHYQITELFRTDYLKSATSAVAADVFRKTACFPQTPTYVYLMKVILEGSQNNITCCLLEISLPCSRIAEEPPTTRSTNPQTLTNSHSACLRKHHCCFSVF